MSERSGERGSGRHTSAVLMLKLSLCAREKVEKSALVTSRVVCIVGEGSLGSKKDFVTRGRLEWSRANKTVSRVNDDNDDDTINNTHAEGTAS